MKRFLVTGATGFLGRHLVAALRAEGHDVVALVRDPKTAALEGARLVHGDVLDSASVERAMAEVDGVFHCAGKVSRRPADAELLQRTHVDGTRNVARACISQNVKRLVIASTSGTLAVSDDPSFVATEDDPAPLGLIQRWPYYRSKFFAEKAALEMHGTPLSDASAGTLEVISVNPTLLLGPGDINSSSTEDVRKFLERRIPAIAPGGLSYVDVRDAAKGMRLAMERGTGGRKYLLGACNVTIREFFARLERVSGIRAPQIPLPSVARPFARWGAEAFERWADRAGVSMSVDSVSIDMANHYWYLDASLAERELGWEPRDPMATLLDTVRDLEERGVVWPIHGGPANASPMSAERLS